MPRYSETNKRVEDNLLPSAAAARALLATVVVCAASLVRGQAPVAPAPSASANGPIREYIQEFFLSEAVRSQERNEFQLTLGSNVFSGHGSSLDGKSAGVDMEYGLSDRLQLGFEAPYGIQSTSSSEVESGWSTADISLLYQFIRSSHPFALSGAFGVNAPLAPRGALSYEPELLIAKEFGKLQIHTSVIPELGADEKSLGYNIALLHPIPHHWIPTLEFSGRRNAGLNSFYVTTGIYKHLPHRFEMGAAVAAGMGTHSSPVGAIFKMTWEVGGDGD